MCFALKLDTQFQITSGLVQPSCSYFSDWCGKFREIILKIEGNEIVYLLLLGESKQICNFFVAKYAVRKGTFHVYNF